MRPSAASIRILKAHHTSQGGGDSRRKQPCALGLQVVARERQLPQPAAAYVSQHTYVSKRQHTSAYASIRQHTPAYESDSSRNLLLHSSSGARALTPRGPKAHALRSSFINTPPPPPPLASPGLPAAVLAGLGRKMGTREAMPSGPMPLPPSPRCVSRVATPLCFSSPAARHRFVLSYIKKLVN
jgi:hypothetical protein